MMKYYLQVLMFLAISTCFVQSCKTQDKTKAIEIPFEEQLIDLTLKELKETVIFRSYQESDTVLYYFDIANPNSHFIDKNYNINRNKIFNGNLSPVLRSNDLNRIWSVRMTSTVSVDKLLIFNVTYQKGPSGVHYVYKLKNENGRIQIFSKEFIAVSIE